VIIKVSLSYREVRAVKKTTLILLMLLLIVFAACADWPQASVIRLKTSVHNQITISEANENAIATKGKPLYVLELKIDEREQNSEQEVDFFLASTDVSSENVTVEFHVSQSVPIRTNESITLLISATPLSFIDADNFKYSTGDVILGYKEVDPDNIILDASIDEGANSMSVIVSYVNAGRVVPADTKLFIFTAEWESDEELKAHPGTYTGEVSLTYLTE
jgi:hypothetical protein